MIKGIMKRKQKTKNMEKWVNFIKLKCAHWQPTKHSEVCAAHFTDENYTNLFADLTDNSCNRFKQKLKSVQWFIKDMQVFLLSISSDCK